MKLFVAFCRGAVDAVLVLAAILAIGLLVSALMAGTAHAQCHTGVRALHHGHVVHQRAIVHHKAAVVASPVILYQAGSHLYVDAQLRRLAKEAAKEGAAEFYAQLAAELAAEEANYQPPQSQGGAPGIVPQVANYLSSSCLKCHNGPGSPGGVDLSNPDALTLFRAADSVREGRMPKGSGQPDPAAAALLQEAARLSLAP